MAAPAAPAAAAGGGGLLETMMEEMRGFRCEQVRINELLEKMLAAFEEEV